MANIKVVTDSSVQLTQEEIEKYDITVIPLTITIDGENYVDGVDISRADFVKKMNEAENLPKTSQPAIGKFEEVFKELTKNGNKVIGIFLSRGLSGTVDTARQAAQLVDRENNIKIIDSELTDRDEGFQVLAAAKDAQAGKSMDEIIAHIKDIRNNQVLEMMVVNLDNLIKGGRLGALAGKIATFLNIRIALTMHNGQIEIEKKGRGKKFSKNFDKRVLADIEKNKDRIKEVGISYVNTPEQSQELVEKIKAISPDINVLVQETSPIIATHAGNGAYAILYYLDK